MMGCDSGLPSSYYTQASAKSAGKSIKKAAKQQAKTGKSKTCFRVHIEGTLFVEADNYMAAIEQAKAQLPNVILTKCMPTEGGPCVVCGKVPQTSVGKPYTYCEEHCPHEEVGYGYRGYDVCDQCGKLMP